MGDQSSSADWVSGGRLSLRSSILAVVDELKRFQAEGENSIRVEPLVLDAFESKVKALSQKVSGGAPSEGDVSREVAPKPERDVSPSGGPELHPIRIEPFDRPKALRKPSRSVPAEAVPDADFGPAPVIQLPDGSRREQWEWLRERVLGCEVCQRNLNPGKQVVFGVGSLEADLFFCGEAPGAEEETRGEPFVGPAGELLDKMIGAMGLSREKVYIANIMNWRPRTGKSFGNRPPTPTEMAFCLPYLKAQLDVVRPKVVVALGATAAAGLLGIETRGKMGKLRGTWHQMAGNVPVTITYHPSYLLHNQSLSRRRQVWEDLMGAMEKVGLPISKQQRGYFLSRGSSN